MSDIEIATADGPMRAIVAQPATNKGGVIMFPHVGGLTDTMRTMAQIVADGGHVCVVPDLYHRLGTIVLDPQSNDQDAVAIRRLAAASVADGNAMRDAAAVIAWLNQQRIAKAFGAAGFGRGGGLALLAAASFPGDIAAAASILGFAFPERDMLTRITGEIYCAFAEHDDIIPREVPQNLAKQLTELPLTSRLVVHAGARHPYVFPDRAVHAAKAAAEDWASVFAMFGRHLGRNPPEARGSAPSTPAKSLPGA
jgi:carboxymethylenebutenolidase